MGPDAGGLQAQQGLGMGAGSTVHATEMIEWSAGIEVLWRPSRVVTTVSRGCTRAPREQWTAAGCSMRHLAQQSAYLHEAVSSKDLHPERGACGGGDRDLAFSGDGAAEGEARGKTRAPRPPRGRWQAGDDNRCTMRGTAGQRGNRATGRPGALRVDCAMTCRQCRIPRCADGLTTASRRENPAAPRPVSANSRTLEYRQGA
jgi:hypothetical protein